MKRQSGEELTHEEVINKLDDETVQYDATFGFSSLFPENLRIAIKAEAAFYESTVAWLRDLVYSSKFDEERCVLFFGY
jgi:hypothetical protein